MSEEKDNITFEIDPEKVKDMIAEALDSKFKDLKESLVPKEVPASATEPMDKDEPEDYRDKLLENLREAPTMHNTGWKWKGPQDNEESKKLVGAIKLSQEKRDELKESLTCVDADSAIPEIWAAEVERLSVYPNSAFWGAPFINWKRDIQGKPGDTVNVITVAPVTCADLVCGTEPSNDAPTISKVPITLVDKVCPYCICKNDLDDVVPDTITKINESMATCLDVCIDNYFLAQALVGSNLGTYTHTAGMTGSLIARAMGSMEAGTYEPAVLIMHPVVYKGLMMDSQFTNAATFGNRSVIERGRIDSYLGVQMIERPKGTLAVGGGTYRSLLLANGAIAGAVKHGVTLETEYVARLQRRYVLATVRFGGTVVHTNGVFWVITVQS